MMFSWIFNYAYVGGVLLLFMHFFYNEYFVGKKGKKPATPKPESLKK